MIIVISSPPPIDTTELAEKLASQNYLKVIKDPAPLICREYGFQTIYDMPVKLQTEIREKLIKDHAEFVKSNDNILLNYSVFGYLADWMRWACKVCWACCGAAAVALVQERDLANPRDQVGNPLVPPIGRL